jgi:hypothetical protein
MSYQSTDQEGISTFLVLLTANVLSFRLSWLLLVDPRQALATGREQHGTIMD